MSNYPLHLTIEEVLPTYYKDNGFDDDGGKSKPYARVEVMPKVVIYIPNTEGRKEVIVLHDIHHLSTGYSNKMSGELEIAAWEAASNCTNKSMAFLLNVGGMLLGFLYMPSKMWKAWKLGRRTKNLYRVNRSEDELKRMTIGEMQGLLQISERDDINLKTTIGDVLHLSVYLIISLILNLFSLVTLPFMLIYSGIIALKLKRNGVES